LTSYYEICIEVCTHKFIGADLGCNCCMQLLSGGNQVKYIMSFYRHLIVLKSKLTNSKSLIPITFLSYEVLLSNFHVKEIKNRIGICDTVAVIREAPKLSEFEKKKVFFSFKFLFFFYKTI